MTKTTTKEREPTLFGATPKVDAEEGSPARKKTAVAKAEPKAKKTTSTAVAVRTTEPMEASSANLMMMVAQIARDPNSDPKKMEAVLNVITTIRAEEDRRAFTAAMLKMKPLLPEIGSDGCIVVKAKDARGERSGRVIQKTPFSTYPNIHRTVTPILTAHGFVYDSWVEPGQDGRINVVGQLDHIGGHFRKSVFPLPAEASGSKNNVQGYGSSASFGKRYNIILLIDLVSFYRPDSDRNGFQPDRGEETVVDGAQKPRLSAEDVGNLKEKIKACGVSTDEFCRFFKIAKVEDLPSDQYDEASDACAQYGERRKGGAR